MISDEEHNVVSAGREIVVDPVTGLPVLTLDENASALSSKEVEEILENLP